MTVSHIDIKGVNKIFNPGENAVVALKDINLHIPDGQFVCLLGPSGCGKSTLLHSIAGLVDVSAGRVEIGGRDMTHADKPSRPLAPSKGSPSAARACAPCQRCTEVLCMAPGNQSSRAWCSAASVAFFARSLAVPGATPPATRIL